MTKEELIKIEWGEYYEEYKKYIDENGFINYKNLPNNIATLPFISKIYKNNNTYFRPKSLQGIEDNNGWIKIESEEDLPKKKGHYEVIWNNKNVIKYWYGKDNIYADLDKQNYDWMKQATHYAPIEKQKPPIH